MPWTFSHPIAVVPLWRSASPRLNLAALVIGSLAPDFGYYAQAFDLATYAHTVPGTLLVCLPTGLLAWGIFQLVRRPLCYLLPQPHRAALWPLATPPNLRWRTLAGAALAILVGTWTHTIWDSFTHASGWMVQHWLWLQMPLHVGIAVVPVSYVLQQVSTVGGAIGLAWLYWRWLQLQRIRHTERNGNGVRYCLLAGTAIFALVIAAVWAWRAAALYEGFLAFRVWVFRTGVLTGALFVPLIIAVALIFSRRHQHVVHDP